MTWKPVPDFPNYEVSDKGEVRNIKRHKLRKLSKGRYVSLSLCRNDGIRYTAMVHILVMHAFVGPRPEGMQIRHLDGNPHNNCLTNLAYGTGSENYQDQVIHGVAARGVRNGRSILTERHVRVARGLHRIGFNCVRISEIMSVSPTCIKSLVNRVTWKHV